MKKRSAILAFMLAALPTAALAHPGPFHVHDFSAGVLHPLTGADHLAAMVAVGVWAAQRGGRALWLWPISFVSAMIAGGALGMAGVQLPFIEPMIMASTLVLGVMVVTAAPLPRWAGAAIIATFGLFHGDAHGLEAPLSANSLLYGLGFVAATSLLHVIGVGAGLLLVRVTGRRGAKAAT